MEEVIGKRGKKLVKWGPGLVVFLTKEAKVLGWGSDSLVRVSVVKDNDKKKIVIEEVGKV